MDLDKILHFVPAHIEQIIAVLGALFLVTTILLLIRSLKEKPEDSSGGLDVRTLEGTLKRVLAQTPPTVVEKPVTSGEGTTVIADLAPLKNALAEKEKQLSQLNAELTEAKAAAAAAAAGSASLTPAGETEGSSTAVAALELEISDLKARLAEYEIIEDDIADLALYKEENARLKREIEEARTTGGGAQATPAFVEANPAAGIPGLTEALQEEAAATKTSTPAKPEVDDLAELLASAEAADAPAATATPSPEPAPTADADPLGLPDTDKMLSEAESLAAAAPAEDEPEINALSDLLDTDKLLEEVSSLDAQDVMSEFKDKSKLG